MQSFYRDFMENNKFSLTLKNRTKQFLIRNLDLLI
jgi:hypothetical protein